jgi:chaperone required for assembly of F1-ATPase
MREVFDIMPPGNPIEAVQRDARPALRRRFYEGATAVPISAGYAVRLDDQPIRTPARGVLAAPTLALAEAIAAEWQVQQDVIDPAKMPLTRLANAIIDGVADAPQPVADEIAKYLRSDLLFYRAGSPPGLVERQARHWDPILDWARQALGADFKLGEGVVYVAQPEAALAAARAAIPEEPWRLGAAHSITTLSGSALIALAMARGALAADAAWQAAHVDEDWNMAQWGRDAMAMARRDFRLAEFQAAATVLSCSPG